MDSRACGQRFNWWLSVAFCVVYAAAAVLMMVTLGLKAQDMSIGYRFFCAIVSNCSCLMVVFWWPSRKVLQQYESLA